MPGGSCAGFGPGETMSTQTDPFKIVRLPVPEPPQDWSRGPLPGRLLDDLLLPTPPPPPVREQTDNPDDG